MARPFLLLLLLSLLLPPSVRAGMVRHDIEPATLDVGFQVRYLAVARVTGRFTDIAGTFDYDPVNGQLGAVDVTIGTASVDTGSKARDRDLRGAGFFDTGQFPYMRFVATNASIDGPDQGHIDGVLTLRGMTRPVRLDVTRDGTVATAITRISRSDFGMRYGVVGLFIADKVDISIVLTALPTD